MKLPIAATGSLQNPAFRGNQLCFTRFAGRYNSGVSSIGIFDLNKGPTRLLGFAGEANVSEPGSTWNNRGLIFSSDGYAGPDRACYWDGNTVHVLYHKPDMTWEPSWGSDFYVAERHRSGEGPGQLVRVYLNNLDNIENITAIDRDCRQPCVSPDSKEVIFQEQVGDEWRLNMLYLADKSEIMLGPGTDATFSHSGDKIVFSDPDGNLRTMGPNGKTSLVKVETKYSGAPSFSPDDKQIAYEGGPSGDDGGPPTSIYIASTP